MRVLRVTMMDRLPVNSSVASKAPIGSPIRVPSKGGKADLQRDQDDS